MLNVTVQNQPIAIKKNSPINEILKIMKPKQNILGFLVNGLPQDFFYQLEEGDVIEYLTFSEPQGKYIFWHTSAHILAQAVLEIWPEALPTIGPPIEEGFFYDFANLSISEHDFPKIEEKAKKIMQAHLVLEKKLLNNKNEALEIFRKNKYKQELIKSFSDESKISMYQQGSFYDLCRGPHLQTTGKIQTFKILKTSAAYWKGDSKNDSLVRIYGISFPSSKEMKSYLEFLEEVKKRDHRVLGSKLNLFSQQEAAPGMPFFHPKGMLLWNALVKIWKKKHHEEGYQEILTPQIMSKDLWKVSGHWKNYKDNMYTLEIEEKEFAIKPMNCPGCMLFYKTRNHSYKEFPLKIAEIGHVHRQEASGALSGLMRVRSFHQDDAHIFLTEDQIEEETLNILNLVEDLYSIFGLDYCLELSTKPDTQTIGEDKIWELTTEALEKALVKHGKPFSISKGNGAFYGPKIDIHIHDSLKRSWQCGTIQLDMFLPERFGLEYTSKHGTKEVPTMLHRALFGSIERFIGILIEHFEGKFPLWLSPDQIRVITVADRHIPYADRLNKNLLKQDFLSSLDHSGESVSKKIRKAQLEQVNYMITIGDKEEETSLLTIRTRDNRVIENVSQEKFLETLLEEKKIFSLRPLL